MKHTSSDQHIRDAVLDPKQSFIVQAPAGSGKTELLTQRFLTLLARVETPEEIIAITFTRKAAQEMRHRIMHALQNAATEKPPTEAHKKITFELASKALAHDKKLNWELLTTPSRLRILTLDALSAMIDQQTPIGTSFGAKPDVIEDSSELYERAIHGLLMETSDQNLVEAVNELLIYCQNNVTQLTRLLTQLLATREQWLSHVMPYFRDENSMKTHLESALLVDEAHLIERLHDSCSQETILEISALLTLASQQMMLNEESYITQAIRESTSKQSLLFWQAASELMLTKQGQWRRSVTKKQGFPSASDAPKELKNSFKENKQRMMALLESCKSHVSFREHLLEASIFPKPTYQETHWKQLGALTQALPHLVAQLAVCFQQTGKVDFNELTIGALRALFQDSEPTYLAMQLDHKIKHLLVDECQDTSNLQHELLTRLIDGWSPEDGRTLFLVGDPMQSIYRFRNANVSHFLRIQTDGINRIQPISQQLTRNFRSSSNVIQWINHAFQHVFSSKNDPSSGAIAYAPSQAVKTNKDETDGVHYYPADASNPSEEALIIKGIIEHLQKRQPQANIALLVRARHQLSQILPVLTEAGIAFHANKLSALSNNADIQDLMTLTRALSHLDDRVAWLAFLRSPCFGFTLTDLNTIANDRDVSIITQIQTESIQQQLSTHSQQRLTFILPILMHCLHNAKRLPLHEWVKKAWFSLAGPSSLTHPDNYQHIDTFFAELSMMTDINDLDQFIDHFSQLYADDTCKHASLSVMTIHQSKGLEFDHVILPGLQRANPRNDQPMLRWSSLHEDHLVLACRTRDCSDGIYDYLAFRDKQQTNHELARLFYVACTRAKQSLHLTYQTETPDDNDNAFIKARSGSFLSLLAQNAWDFAQKHVVKETENEKANTDTHADHSLIKTSALNKYLSRINLPESPSEPPEFDPIDRIAQAKGNALHAWLACSANLPDSTNTPSESAKKWIERALRSEGINKTNREQLSNELLDTYEAIRSDSIGSWILKRHAISHCEYPLLVNGKDRPHSLIIDRWFIDDDICWIIDYKTSEHLPSNKEDALDRHQEQLLAYAKAMSQHQNNPIRVGIYYTSQQRWFEWGFEKGTLLS